MISVDGCEYFVGLFTCCSFLMSYVSVSITARLTELGYGVELCFLDELRQTYPLETRITLFNEHNLVRQPKLLTDRGVCFVW